MKSLNKSYGGALAIRALGGGGCYWRHLIYYSDNLCICLLGFSSSKDGKN